MFHSGVERRTGPDAPDRELGHAHLSARPIWLALLGRRLRRSGVGEDEQKKSEKQAAMNHEARRTSQDRDAL
jgi:hypothetical protein